MMAGSHNSRITENKTAVYDSRNYGNSIFILFITAKSLHKAYLMESILSSLGVKDRPTIDWVFVDVFLEMGLPIKQIVWCSLLNDLAF